MNKLYFISIYMYLTAVLFANSTPGELHVGELSSGEEFVIELEIIS